MRGRTVIDHGTPRKYDETQCECGENDTMVFGHVKPPAGDSAGKEARKAGNRKNVPRTEQRKFSVSKMLHQLQVHRQILYDLAALHLGPMSGRFERLFYLSGLRNTSSGMYAHERLSAQYGEQPVHEALGKAHEEMFEGILELPLAQQEQDLRLYLQTTAAKTTTTGPDDFNYFEDGLQNCIPVAAPAYLRELFLSNVSVLRVLLQSLPPTARSNT